MAVVRKLRAVKADEKAPRRRPSRKVLTVAQAAASGDRRALLVAMRARIGQAVDDPKTPAPALAALLRQLADVDREIGSIDLGRGQKRPASSAVADTPDETFDYSKI